MQSDEPRDDSAARAARAARLRQQIEKLTQPHPDPATEKPTPPESPREFIERRMRQLDRKPE